MSSPINSELEENYNKRRILQSVSLFMFLLFIALIALNPSDRDFILFGILIVVIMLIAINYTPYLSKYDLIRYHLKKLIVYSKNGHVNKSEKHINKLAYHISEFNSELENIFILSPTKQTLDKFLDLLRCQIYPHLTESDLRGWSDSLEDVNIAMDHENIKLLNDTLDKFISKETVQKSNVLFSYEKPSISERFTKETIHLIKNNKRVNFITKFIFVLIVLVGFAYFFSPKLPFLEFNNYIFGILLLISPVIADKI